MIEMKDSGVEWIGKIPADWNVTKIKYLFSSGKGLSITKADLEDNGLPVISYGQIHSKENTNTDIKDSLIRFVDNKYEVFKQCKVNQYDFVFADTSEDYDGCGNCCYKRDNSTLYAGYHSIVLHSFKERDNRFLAYLFKTDSWRKQLRETASGVKVFSITQKKLINTSVILPPENQRIIIADFLDQKCSEIDALTADIQTQIETLEEYKKSVITEAVTKGLDPNVEMKDSGVEWIGKIPASWSSHPLYYYFDERKNRNFDLRERNLLSLSYGNIIRKDINTTGGLLPASFNTYNIVKNLDIIIRPTDLQNDKKSLRTALVKEKIGIITSAYIALKPREGVFSNYFHYLLHSYDIMKVFYNMGNGVRQGLNYSEFSKLILVAPSLEEQHKIADFLDQKCSEIDQTISEKQQQLETLAEYKKSLIYEYVTGKKEVA